MFIMVIMLGLSLNGVSTTDWEAPDPQKVIEAVESQQINAEDLAILCSQAFTHNDILWVLTIDSLIDAESSLRDNAALLAELGAANLQYGNDGVARQQLEKAKELDLANADVHNNLGVLWRRKGLYMEAETELRAAIALAAEKPEPHYNLAVVMLRMGRLEEAIQELQRALSDPSYVAARRLAGFLALEAGRATDAADYLEKYFELCFDKDEEFSDEEALQWLMEARDQVEAIKQGEPIKTERETKSYSPDTKR